MSGFLRSGLEQFCYFLPKLTHRPLHSYYLAQLSFWGIALFGGWGFINVNAPLPSWIPALSAVLGAMMLLPVLGVALNVRGTISGYRSTTPNPIFSLVLFGAFSFVFVQLLNVLSIVRPINQMLAFTYFSAAQTHWLLLGFFASAIFGAIYYIAPLILNIESPAASKVRFHALILFSGVVIYGVSLLIGGIVQGTSLRNANADFPDVIKSTFFFLHISTLGSLLIVIAGLLLLVNLLSLGCRAGRACWKNCKKAEVRS